MRRLGFALLCWATTAVAVMAETACFEARAWPEADVLFQGDPHWSGADGAYSIELGGDRTLWLFGDSWIDPSGRHARENAKMVRNSVAIQTGNDPSRSSIEYYWTDGEDHEPQSFFPGQGDEWFWPGHGVQLDDHLIVFLHRLRRSAVGLGFESAGWNAVMIDNPDAEPSDWHWKMLVTPADVQGIPVGFASVLRDQDYLYAFGSVESAQVHPIHVARWPLASANAGQLMDPEWWGGDTLGWVTKTSTSIRPIFQDGQSELTIHFDENADHFLAIQTIGFGKADIAIRSAARLTGPWTPSKSLYRPPEYDRPNVMIYAAKAHPQLVGSDLVLTYANNSTEFRDHMTDPTLYYPRFVRLARCN